MKKVISLFISMLIILSTFCALPVFADGNTQIWYEKTGNDIVVSVENLEADQAILYCAAYDGGKMVSLTPYLIENHTGSYTSKTINMTPGYEYKFYVWDTVAFAKPLCTELAVSARTVVNSGSTPDVMDVLIVEGSKVVDIYADEYECEFTYKENIEDSVRYAKSVYINSDANIYINSVLQENMDFADIEDYIYGHAVFTLTKAKSDKLYQNVYLTSYVYKIVKEVLVEKERILFYEGGSLKLDPEVRDYENFSYNMYDGDGKVITLEDVKEDDVLNILVPGDDYSINEAPSLEIYVTSNVFEGTVTEQTGYSRYVIDGKEYFTHYIDFYLGQSGKFYISIDGKIVGADTSVEINKNFAVVSFAEAIAKMGKSTYELELLTKEGIIESYTLASKVKIYDWDNYNGCVYSDTTATTLGEKFCNVIDMCYSDNVADRVITFKTNENGEISEIRMPGYTGLYDCEIHGVWDEQFREFDGWQVDNAPLMIVPYEAFICTYDGMFTIDEDEVSVTSFNELSDGYEYGARIYMTEEEEEDYRFSFAVSNQKIEKSWADVPLSVVKKVSTVLVDGKKFEKITFVQSGEIKSLINESYSNELCVGDVFQYALDKNGEIYDMRVVYRFNDEVIIDWDAAELMYEEDGYAYSLGYLADFDGEYIELACDYNTNDGEVITEFYASESYELAEGEFTYSHIGRQYILRDYESASSEINPIALEDIVPAKKIADNKAALVKLNEDGQAADIIIIDVADEMINCDLKSAPEIEITGGYSEAPLAVVTKVTSVLVDGWRTRKITFVQSGETQALTTEISAEGTEEDFGLEAGDVFQYTVNENGEIKGIRMILDYSEGLALTNEAGSIGYEDNGYSFALGYLARKNDAGIAVTDEFWDDDGFAEFGWLQTIKTAKEDAFTYAKVDLYGLSREDKTAIKAVDLDDIEASKDYLEVPAILVKINREGQAEDIIVFEDLENGLYDEAIVDVEFEEYEEWNQSGISGNWEYDVFLLNYDTILELMKVSKDIEKNLEVFSDEYPGKYIATVKNCIDILVEDAYIYFIDIENVNDKYGDVLEEAREYYNMIMDDPEIEKTFYYAMDTLDDLTRYWLEDILRVF